MSEVPLLVTGCQRSGNTWLARMLSAGPGTRHVYQPFNGSVMRRPEALRWPFRDHKFTWVERATEARFVAPVRAVLRPRLPPEYLAWELQRALRTRSSDPLRRYVTTMGELLDARRRHLRPVIGDPGGIFLARWLHERFGVEVVALHRHPAAIAAGYKRMEWQEDLGDLLGQPHLMAGPLAPLADWLAGVVERQRAGATDWLDIAVAWWVVFERLVEAQRGPGLREVWFEDIAEAPVDAIEGLYARFGLAFSPSARDEVRSHTQAPEAAELGRSTHVLRRDTRSLATAWRRRLTPEEIARVMEQVEPFLTEAHRRVVVP